jgi:hypothetical protein
MVRTKYSQGLETTMERTGEDTSGGKYTLASAAPGQPPPVRV